MIISISPNNFPSGKTRVFAIKDGFDAPQQIPFVRFAMGKIALRNIYSDCTIVVLGQSSSHNGDHSTISVFTHDDDNDTNNTIYTSSILEETPKFVKYYPSSVQFPIQPQILDFIKKFNKPLAKEFAAQLKRYNSLQRYQEKK